MTKEVQVYVRGLPDVPGWEDLNPKQKEVLQGLTSNFVTSFRKFGIAWMETGAILEQIEIFLDGGPVSMRKWMETVLPSALGVNDRTARDIQSGYRKLKEFTSQQGIEYLAKEGLAGLNSAGMNRILPVLEKNPAPKDPKQLPEWRDKVIEGVKKRFSDARKKRSKGMDPEDALKQGAVVINRLIRESNLPNSVAKNNWLARLVGYVKQKQAIGGTVMAERTSIPDGWWPKQGPKGPHKKKK